jgi:hypothetical protein
MVRTKDLQKIISLYRQKTGKNEISMREVAEFAARELKMELPTPQDPLDLLAKKFAIAAREETRKDKITNRPYRVNHAVPMGSQQTLWVDIDQASRGQMHKSLITRRNQIIGDALQLDLDAEHWNNINPTEAPIQIPLDFTEDVEERKNIESPFDTPIENDKRI